MASRALPDLVARIRIDSSGVDQAVSNLTGTFGKANLAMAGIAAGAGIVILGAKSMIDIAEAHDKATASLKQATEAQGYGVRETKDYNAQIDAFIKANPKYIESQSDVIDGFATLTRAGLDTTKAQKDMNIALDLATLKHIPLAQAVDVVNKAEQGRFRGLIDLGVSVKGVTAGNLDQVASQDRIASAMKELKDKTDKGRQSQTELEQSGHELSNRWQTIAEKHGPMLLKSIDVLVEGANGLWDAMDRFSRDDSWWKGFNDGIVKIVDGANLKQLVQIIDALVASWQWLDGPHSSSAPGPVMGQRGGNVPRAGGGPVLPNSIYTVGERGPETLVMGASGGTVIPNSGGGTGTVRLANDRQGDVVALLARLVQLAERPNSSIAALFTT